MIANHSFICMGEDIKDTPFSKYHLMKRLATSNKILYVESIGVRAPRVSKRDLRRLLTKLSRWLRGYRLIAPNFFVVYP